ncbi:tetratricopeptide repeat protein [Chloroflexota bacterium]
MKKFVTLCIISLLVLLLILPAVGCQAQSVQSVQSDKHYKNSTALVIDGEYEEAIEELNETIRLYPEYAEAYYIRGLAYDNSGEVAKAISDYEKCIELSSDPVLIDSAQMLLYWLRR